MSRSYSESSMFIPSTPKIFAAIETLSSMSSGDVAPTGAPIIFSNSSCMACVIGKCFFLKSSLPNNSSSAFIVSPPKTSSTAFANSFVSVASVKIPVSRYASKNPSANLSPLLPMYLLYLLYHASSADLSTASVVVCLLLM